jgi:RNA polymerase sigma-70 factor (ECF subfamily)
VLEALGDPRILAADAAPRDDAWFLARFRRGDEAAFEALYRRQERRIYALALRLSQRPEEAADLTQEVFVKAWEGRAKFESFEHFTRWLRRVVVNDWLNGVRKKRPLELDARRDGDEEGAEPEFEAPPLRDSPSRIDLERAIGALSPRLRAVLVLFDVYGHNHDEIAGMLEMTPGAAKVQLHRARRKLQEMLR